MTIASGLASSKSSSVTEYGPNTSARAVDSPSLPMEIQVSVTTTSAPATAATGSRSSTAEPPVPAAMRAPAATIAAAGS
jgi:hypothetical protein